MGLPRARAEARQVLPMCPVSPKTTGSLFWGQEGQRETQHPNCGIVLGWERDPFLGGGLVLVGVMGPLFSGVMLG